MSSECFLHPEEMIPSQELRKILRLYVLQDEKIDVDWISPIYKTLIHGRDSNYILQGINMHLKCLNLTQIILKEELRYTAFIFMHSQDVIHSEVLLSSHHNGEWRRVKVVNQKNPNTFIYYMMFVPKYIKPWKSSYCLLEDLIALPYCSAIFWFDLMMQSVPSLPIPSLSEDFLKGVKIQSIFNLVYIKEIGTPCVLFPQEMGIRLEFDSFANNPNRNIPVASCSLSSQYILIPSHHFINKGCAGHGASGICNILEVPEDLSEPLKTFVSKEISTRRSGTPEYSSDVSLSPRSQILEEISIMNKLNKLEIPYIVKQFTVPVSETDDLLLAIGAPKVNSNQPVVLYKWEEEETKFFSTMELINGTDIRNVDVVSLDDLTKFSIVLHVTEALNVLHKNGFVHNDLHLGNMRLESSTNKIFILDFGCCERITEANARKDLKYLLKLIYHLYGIEASSSQQHINVPEVLRPIVEDALKNIDPIQRKYKTVGEILENLFFLNQGVVLDQRLLDFGFFLEHRKFYMEDSFQEYLAYLQLYEVTSFKLDQLKVSFLTLSYRKHLCEQEKILEKYLEDRKEAFALQKIFIQELLEFHNSR